MTWRIGSLDTWDDAVRAVISSEVPPGFSIAFATSHEPDEQMRIARDSDVLIVGWPEVTAAMMAGAPRLRMIQKWGIGVDRIDLAAAEREGIIVAIAAGSNAHAVAEHAVMLMLAVYRKLPLVDSALRDGTWLFTKMRSRCLQLRGKTIGLVGFGNIGRAVARKLRGFDVHVVYYDPRRAPAALEQELGARFVSFAELLAQSDIVSLHCPGGAETRDMIDAQALAAMKPGAVLINTARGEIVNEGALADALRGGPLFGAGLDVYEPEPTREGFPLLDLDNVVLTSHTAGSVWDNVANVAQHCFGNIRKVLNGEALAEADRMVVPATPRRVDTSRT